MAQAGEGRSVKKALVDWTRGSVLIVIRNHPSSAVANIITDLGKSGVTNPLRSAFTSHSRRKYRNQ